MEVRDFADATEDPVMRCKCGGELEMEESNGVVDPDSTRWERHRCTSCGDTGLLVMPGGDTEDWASGCIQL